MNKIKPTKKQLRTMEIKQSNPEISLGEAMVKAGYSKKTSRSPKQNYLDKRGTQVALEELKLKMADLGVNTDFYAKKLHEWATATKIKTSITGPDRIVPDYQTQLAVKEDLKEILDLKMETPANQFNQQINIVVKEGLE